MDDLKPDWLLCGPRYEGRKQPRRDSNHPKGGPQTCTMTDKITLFLLLFKNIIKPSTGAVCHHVGLESVCRSRSRSVKCLAGQ